MAGRNPLSKLARDGGGLAADRLSASMVAAVRKAQRNIRLRVIEAATSRSAYAQSDRRDALYASIAGVYGELSRGLDSMLRGLATSVAQEGLMAADADIGTGKVVKYSPERLRRYWEYVRPGNSKSLAAVYTDKMTDVAIEQLRRAHIDTYRQAAVEGWTANQAQKAMQARWDELSGNEDAFRFVDKSGRKWENARYLQMLARTTAQRVSRDSYIDRLTEEGINIGRISSDGDEDCDICRVWEGVIVQLTGKSKKWPTWAEAQEAGVGHPNCLHSVQYIDDVQDAEEIRRQGTVAKVSPDNDSALVERKDTIDEARYRAEGMDAETARREVTRDRIRQGILSRTFSIDASRAVNYLEDDTIDALRKRGLPRVAMIKRGESTGYTPGATGGVIRVPRTATAKEVAALFEDSVPKKAPPVPPVVVQPKQPPSKVPFEYRTFNSTQAAVKHMGTLLPKDDSDYPSMYGETIRRFRHDEDNPSPAKYTGKVTISPLMTPRAATALSNAFEQAQIASAELGLPPMRGINEVPPVRKNDAASMGDGALSVNTDAFNRYFTELHKDRVWAVRAAGKKPHTTSNGEYNERAVELTVWHEHGHHVHQQWGVDAKKNPKNVMGRYFSPPLEDDIAKAWNTSNKGKDSSSAYATDSANEWFAENYALLRAGMIDKLDKSPSLMLIFKKLGIM